MPRDKETDPARLLERKRRQREKSNLRMRRWRAATKQITQQATAILEHAAEGRPYPAPDHQDSVHGLAMRSATALLKLSLERNGVTPDRIVRVVAEGLGSMRVEKAGNQISSLPDMQHRLRASDVALKLLERAGFIPGARQSEPASSIMVNVLVMSDDPTEQVTTSTTEETSEGRLSDGSHA